MVTRVPGNLIVPPVSALPILIILDSLAIDNVDKNSGNMSNSVVVSPTVIFPFLELGSPS